MNKYASAMLSMLNQAIEDDAIVPINDNFFKRIEALKRKAEYNAAMNTNIFSTQPVVRAPMSEFEMMYTDAVLYCQFLEHDGHRDWRMPTAAEYYLNCGDVLGCWFVDRSDALDRNRFVIPMRTVDF
jgi:hypothetical protein